MAVLDPNNLFLSLSGLILRPKTQSHYTASFRWTDKYMSFSKQHYRCGVVRYSPMTASHVLLLIVEKNKKFCF